MSLLRGSVAIFIILAMPKQPIAIASEESEYLCFLATSSGKVIDLSSSLCKSKELGHKETKLDLSFIEEYKNQAIKYADVRDNLIGNIERLAEERIEQAKNVCVDIKAGMTLDEIAEDRLEENRDRASRVNTSIINLLATKFYCKDL